MQTSAIAPFTGIRRPPASLSERGKEIWRETIDLVPGIILQLDAALIERFCSWRDLLERSEHELVRSRGPARRRAIQEVIEICRHHILNCAARLGLTPESHLRITGYLETPDGRAAHQALKKIFEKRGVADRMGRSARAAN